MLQLCLPFASPSPNSNPSSSPTPKGGKQPWMEEKTQGGMGELPNTPSILQEALQTLKNVSLSWKKKRNVQNLVRRKIKYSFFDLSATPLLNLVSTPIEWCSTSLLHCSALYSLTTFCIWSTRHGFSGTRHEYLLQIEFFLSKTCSLEFLLVFNHQNCFLLTYFTHS